MVTLFDENWARTVIILIGSGIAGTLVMTVFMNILSAYNNKIKSMHVVLRTMLPFRRNPGNLSWRNREVLTGYAAHYGIGIFFMFLYHVLWQYEIVYPDFIGGLFLGAAGGIISIIFWYWFFVIHPNPPSIPLKGYFINVFLAHFVFALTAIAAYHLLTAIFRMV